MLDSAWSWYADIMQHPRAILMYRERASSPCTIDAVVVVWSCNESNFHALLVSSCPLPRRKSQSKRIYANYSRWMQLICQRQRDAICVSATTDRMASEQITSQADILFFVCCAMQIHDKLWWEIFTSMLIPSYLTWPTVNDILASLVLILAVVFHAWMCPIIFKLWSRSL